MTHKSNKTYDELDKKYYLQTFKRYPLTFDYGIGSHIWDVEGHEYIDMLGGIAVNSVGHCHPKVVKAIQDQAAKLIHISNFYLSEPQVMLSRKLVELSGLDRVFFANSRAESVEGAIKIARKFAHSILPAFLVGVPAEKAGGFFASICHGFSHSQCQDFCCNP